MESWDFLRLRSAVLHDLHQFVKEGYYGSLPSYSAESCKLDYELGKDLLFSSRPEMTMRQRAASDVLMRLGLCGAIEASLELFEDEETRNNARQKLSAMKAELPEFVHLYAEYLHEEDRKRLLANLGKEPISTDIRADRWPWGNHETELLKKMALAANKFWKLYDPSDPATAPTNDQVESFLKEEGVSSRTAQIMATILRADGLPSGPRK
ncbi:hypothetical protein [Nitrosospira sp. Nsp13]|uniref:hypothetical protein n=1 Tax=Nitrosospira sp. Nsp13 TaxID=1855332 RepID=UPI000887FAC4|nr:hypothetical protein [Nitrosospira sp. Nsp13]SCY31164.1 hypothetical protein SAMN05216308_107108 [Nitrosospira sp. Nsp13]